MSKVSPTRLAEMRKAIESDYFKSLVNKELAERSLKEFIIQGWDAIHPGEPFQDNPHIDYLCEMLEQFSMDFISRERMHKTRLEWKTAKKTKKKKLQVNIPPRSITIQTLSN